MDRDCHIESQWLTDNRFTDISAGAPKIHNGRLNRPFTDLHCPRRCIGGLRSKRVPIVLWLAAALLLSLPEFGSAFSFPPLTGRVVDQAGIMNAQSRSELEAKLQNLENKSGIQLVVTTVKSLEGSDIETYANQLFRNWRLGEAKKNNGVLLLVAPNEHKVRIEVGYGLEYPDRRAGVGHHLKRHCPSF